MHFFVATALCLSLVQQSAARIPHSFRQLAERDAAPEPQPEQGIFPWLSRMIKSSLQRRQDTCYQDEFYDFVSNSTFGETFCQAYMRYPNTTTTIEYTPAVTASSIVTTYVFTDNQLVRTTPVTTITTTITPGAVNRRDALPAPAERLIEEAFALFNRQNSPPSSSNAMSAAFSSACACQTYSGVLVTATYTNDPTVVTTLKGFKRTTTTVFTTRTAATITSTVTVTASEASSTSSQAPPVATAPTSDAAVSTSEADSQPSDVQSTELATSVPPTAASSVADTSVPTVIPFTCPDDNNTVVSQMVGNERFDYLVYCDFDLPLDPTFYGQLSYQTFAECAAACSMANANFDEAVCQAAVYFNSPNINSNNCLLKSAANSTTPATGVDAAILQRIAVGMEDPAGGTSTEGLPFTGPTSSIPPAELSSQMSSMMNASSTSLSMITPGPAFIPSGRQVIDFTAFSTYVSEGSTYSTGSRFSTYYTSGGSWYFSYYSSYTVAWASATTVIAYGAQQTAIANTNVTTEYQQGGLNGTYTTVTNTSVTTYTYYTNQTVSNRTDTIVYSSFASGGSFIGDSTTFSSYIATQTINGGSAGGEFETADSGPLTLSVSTTATGTIITVTSSASSGPIATPPPSPSNSVIINSFGTGGVFETGASGAITYTLPSDSASSGSAASSAGGNPPGTVVVNSSGFGSAFSTEDSGPLTESSGTAVTPTAGTPPGTVVVNSSGFGSAFSTEDSGPLTESSSTTVTANAVTANSTGLGSAFSTGFGSAFSTEDSGPLTESSTGTGGPFTANSTGLGSVFSTGFGSAFSTEDSGPLTSSTISPPIALPPSSATSSSEGSSETTSPVSFSDRPRSGTASPPASTETIPVLSSGPGYVPPTPTPSSESGTASSGTLPSSSFSASSGTLPSSPSSPSESAATSSDATTESDTFTLPPTDTRRGRQSTDSTTNIPDFPTSSFPGYVPPVSTSGSLSGTAPLSSEIPSGTAPSSSVQISPSGTAPPSNVPSGTSFSGTESAPTTSPETDTETPGTTRTDNRTGFQSPSASTTSGIPELPTTWPGYLPPSPSTASPSTSEGVPSSGVPSSIPSGSASSGFTTGPSFVFSPSGTGPTTAPPSETESSTTTEDDGFFTNSLGSRISRSRGLGSSTLTGTGDVPSGTGDIPSGTAPFSSGTEITSIPPSGTGPSTAPPSGTGSSTTTEDEGDFTNSLGSRTRNPFPSSSTLSGTGDVPSGTAPFSSGTGDIPSGTAPLSSGTGIISIPPSGTGPSTAPPSGTGSSTTTEDEGDFTNSLGSRTRNPFPSSSTLSGTGDIPSGTAPISSGTGIIPSGTDTPSNSTISGTGSFETTSAPLSTGPLTTAPPLLPSSYLCPTSNLTQATTTVFTTVTLYGCYSQCLPNGGGYYSPNQNAGPQAFGSPP